MTNNNSKIPTLEVSAQMQDVILNNTNGFQHKINWTKNICVVDLSYLTYTRFFGVRDWYTRAFPEKQIPADHDWTSDTDFMAKFYTLFLKKLFAVCRQKLVPTSNIVFAIDCRHNDNWRVLATQSYKETRKDSHAKNNFSNFDIFPYIRRAVIAPLQKEFGNLVLKHNNLEADDMVALFIRAAKLRHMPTNPGCHIYIMANDRDYIQICDAFVHLIDLNDKPISDQIFAPGTGMDARKFLLRKILCGDVSDNIAGCYFNKDFLVKYGVACKRPQLKASDKVLAVLFANPASYAELDRLLVLTNNYHSTTKVGGSTTKVGGSTTQVGGSTTQVGGSTTQVGGSTTQVGGSEPIEPFTEPTQVINNDYGEELKQALGILKDDLFVANARLVDFANIPIGYANEIQTWMMAANI